MKIRYHPLARQEIVETTEYFATGILALVEQFLEEVNAGIDRILLNPLQFEQVRKGIRNCILDRFPYGIYFRMPDDATVRVNVVRHHKRRPGFGMGRK